MKTFHPLYSDKISSQCRTLAAVLLAFALPLDSLTAQTTYTWDGGGTNTSWGTAANWDGDEEPTFDTDAVLVFNTDVGTADTTFIGAQRQIRGIIFGSSLTGGADNVFDIRNSTALGSGSANLLFNGGATNASITLDANTILSLVRLGAGGVGAISLQTTTDLFHNASSVVLQFDANTTGAGSLNKHGVGTVTFTRQNSYNGLNLYGGGAVVWNSATALGTNSVTLGETGSSSNVSLFLGNGLNYTNAITVSSGSGTRLIGNTDVTNQFTGLGFAGITGNATNSGGIDLAAGKDVTFAITNYNTNTTDRLSVRGAITGTGGVVKTGNGILILAASNSYSGTTDIQGGKFYLGSAGRLGSGAVTIASGANLDFGTGAGQTNIVANDILGAGAIIQSTPSTDTRITGDVTSSGGLTIQSGTLRIGNAGTTGSYSGDTVVNSGAVLAFARSNAYTHGGTISGAGGVSKTEAGEATLTGNNSYSGVTTLFDGSLVAGDANALGAGNITFRLEGENTGTIRYTTASAGTDWASRIKNSSGTIRLDTAGNNVTLAGIIDSSNTNGLVKSGFGTLTLGGDNTYSGATTADAGVLAVNGNQSSATGAVTISTTATLAGSGTIGGATTINGRHNPGNSPGVQTFNDGLTYATGSTLVWELTANTESGRGTSFDGVNVAGGVLSINAGVTSDLVFNAAGSTVNWNDSFWGSNRQWQIFDNVSAPTLGSANVFDTINVSEDSAFQSLATVRVGSGFSWEQIDSDVYLNYTIPEPSTYALLALGAAGLGAHVIRRRQRR
jgi:fibronectin-binding autotransporter adhesin